MIPSHPDRDFDIESFHLPQIQSAIVQGANGRLEIRHDVPIPQIRSHQVMVKVMAVALNPCDIKMPARFPCSNAVNGCDFSGIVVALGAETRDICSLRLGDGIFGAVHGSNPSDRSTGAFAEYVAIDAEFTLTMPKTMSWTDAACIGGTGPGTLGLVLKEEMKLAGSFAEPASQPVDVLIWGGSSSIGAMAIQLVTRLGHRATTTCSPEQNSLARANGAVNVFDYHDQDCGTRIREALEDRLRYVMDPFGEAKTMSACYGALGRAGGKYVALEVYPDELATRRSVQAKFVNGFSILGHPVELGSGYGVPGSGPRRAFGIQWFREIQALIDERGLNAHPVQHLTPGFEAILDGLSVLASRQVSARKLVGRLGFDATEVQGQPANSRD